MTRIAGLLLCCCSNWLTGCVGQQAATPAAPAPPAAAAARRSGAAKHRAAARSPDAGSRAAVGQWRAPPRLAGARRVAGVLEHCGSHDPRPCAGAARSDAARKRGAAAARLRTGPRCGTAYPGLRPRRCRNASARAAVSGSRFRAAARRERLPQRVETPIRFPLSPDGELRPEPNHADGRRGLFDETDDHLQFDDPTCVSLTRCRYGVSLFLVQGSGAPIALTGGLRSYFVDADQRASAELPRRIAASSGDSPRCIRTDRRPARFPELPRPGTRW